MKKKCAASKMCKFYFDNSFLAQMIKTKNSERYELNEKDSFDFGKHSS